MHPFAVVVGGVVGTWLRLLLTAGSGNLTWDTRITAVNVVGAFVLGLLIRLPVRPRVRAFVASGLLGSFTSFSVLSIALVDGTPGAGVAAGLAASLGLGLIAAAFGMGLGHLLVAEEEDV